MLVGLFAQFVELLLMNRCRSKSFSGQNIILRTGWKDVMDNWINPKTN